MFLAFCAILVIFANIAGFWAFFEHILCAKFSDSKFCVCYLLSFFHLCPFVGHLRSLLNVDLDFGNMCGRDLICLTKDVFI